MAASVPAAFSPSEVVAGPAPGEVSRTAPDPDSLARLVEEASADLERGRLFLFPVRGGRRLTQAEAAFTVVIDRLSPVAGALDAAGRLILVRALEARAQTRLLRGQAQSADADFALVVSLDPSYAPDPARAPRKTLDRFRRIREARVAYVTFRADPPDASILWNGRELGLASGVPAEFPVLSGPYSLHARRACFEEKDLDGDLTTGEKRVIVVTLDPYARTVEFTTSPAGFDVDLDGTLVGRTGPEATDGTPSTLDARAQDRGVLRLDCIAGGDHTYSVRRDCYAETKGTLAVEIDLLDHSALAVPPITPPKRVTHLSITSDTPSSELFLDGEPAGTLPVRDREICPSRHRIEVRVRDRIIWSETRDLADGPVAIDARRRPTLAASIDASDGPRGLPARVAAGIRARAAKLTSFNTGEAGPERAPADDPASESADLRLEADREGAGLGARVRLRLTPEAAPFLAVSETCAMEDETCLDRFFGAFDASAADVAQDHEPAVAGGDKARRSGGVAIPSPAPPSVPLPRVVASTLQGAAVLPPGAERNASLMALASALIGAGDHRRALDLALERPGWTDGVTGPASRASAALLAGLCHRALGEESAARAAFSRALNDAAATLWTSDGLPVAPLARIELLSGSPR